MEYFYAYIIINFFIKQIPIMFIIDDKINSVDIMFTVVFILAYTIYMNAIKEDIICTYHHLILFVMDKNEKMI
jgi:hypothetical protein